mmetsp:Transcript_14609/g.39086  ORF Transcript_14609/g.39086 Transcript_14609/m.39086 type:complete len:780 (-) Transcript_14609:229-2568(-)|eukprot:CAMPEP_0185832384 /NCGR_PEP_ID=MMETSP1353-20130828/2050_1 /TAXON_ID=1077150 /ORGANISM="Erythrolobus australicus, Strain CCMP3124" /LENGTH=779 /DNA_ID=CAMNT_0028530551 /DNA_START=105 /DNA_END=2444 /DNA_ORIENTATION=-
MSEALAHGARSCLLRTTAWTMQANSSERFVTRFAVPLLARALRDFEEGRFLTLPRSAWRRHNDAQSHRAFEQMLRVKHSTLARASLASLSSGADAASSAHASEHVTLMVNGRTVSVEKGASVLDAARAAGVYVPSLCYHPSLQPTGTCRLCLVDIVRNNPARGKSVVACATPAADGMVVLTSTPALSEHVHDSVLLQRHRHPDKCQTCAANGACEFQDLITRYDVPKPARVNPRVKPSLEREGIAHANDSSSPALELDFQMCVLCLRCVRACSELQGMNILGVVARGNDEVVAPVYSLELADTECISCGACVAACPVAAITEKDAVMDVKRLLERNIDVARLTRDAASGQGELTGDPRKYVTVVQTAPAVRVTLSEAFGLPPGSSSTGQLVSALKMLGFDYVFDTNFTADLTIVEEAHELLERVKNGGPFPMFTSCCPAWVNMVEKVYPQLLPHLSSCKSPQQMFGAIAKSYFAQSIGRPPEEVKVVSVMPCVAKKDEAQRPQLTSAAKFTCSAESDDHDTYVQKHWRGEDEDVAAACDGRELRASRKLEFDVDYVLTTRELARLIKMHRPRIHYAALPERKFDSPLGETTGAALLFGATGGVMEAALRTAHAVTAPPGSGVMPRLRFEEVRGLAGIREATVDLHGMPLRVAVASQGANVRALAERVLRGELSGLHFVEMMACRGGCIGGAGNPKDAVDTKLLEHRAAAIYSGDEAKTIRRSHENPDIVRLYADFLGQPLGKVPHELLHTNYAVRESRQTRMMKEEDLSSKEVLDRHMH